MKDLPYLKLFTEARNDPKLRALYKGSPAYFWVWFNLFCYSGEQPERGKICRSLYLIAVEVADGDADLLRNACNAMQALQLVTCNVSVTLQDPENVVISIHNFDKWQDGKKPSDKAERVRDRVRKCRENKKKEKEAMNTNTDNSNTVTPVTPHVTPHVTPLRGRGREEEEETPPNPPVTGGGAGESIEPEDAEPFHADSTGLAPEPEPRVRNDPAVVKRVAATADRLFPELDYGPKVFQLQGDYDMAVLEAALFDAHAETDARKHRWTYIKGIYTNRMTDGRGAEMAPTKPNGRPPEYRPELEPFKTPKPD